MPRDPARWASPYVGAVVSWWHDVYAKLGAFDPEISAALATRMAADNALPDNVREWLLSPELTPPIIQRVHAEATREQTAIRALMADGTFKYIPFPYGKFKDRPNTVHRAQGVQLNCPPEHVLSEMSRYVEVYSALPDHPAVRAAWLVGALYRIHPFADGNGRVGRWVLNREFLKLGLPPVWVEGVDKGSGWNDACAAAIDQDDYFPFVRLIEQRLDRLTLKFAMQVDSPADLPIYAGWAAAQAARERRREAFAPWRATMADRLPLVLQMLVETLEQTVPGAKAQVETTPARSLGDTVGTLRVYTRQDGYTVALSLGFATLFADVYAVGATGVGLWMIQLRIAEFPGYRSEDVVIFGPLEQPSDQLARLRAQISVLSQSVVRDAHRLC